MFSGATGGGFSGHWRAARFRSIDHGVVYGALELGMKFKCTLQERICEVAGAH